jgi:hypothetical protein
MWCAVYASRRHDLRLAHAINDEMGMVGPL